MQTLKRAFITGSNRGLGYQLIKILNKKYSELQLHISLRKDSEYLAKQWKKHIPNHRFKCYEIELNQTNSVETACQFLIKNGVQFDFIVANAAVRMSSDYEQAIPSFETARYTLQTNLISTIDFSKKFLPLLTQKGRIIIVSSDFGALNFHSQKFQKRLTNPHITEEQIVKISQQYIQAAKEQKMEGFNWSPYKVSKALLNSWSRFILPKYLKKGQSFICMHPGWCRTDMGGPNAYFTPQYGAELIQECFWLKQIQKDRFYNGKFCSYVQCQ